MSRDILLGSDVRRGMKSGIDKVADAVRVTLGVRGKNIIIDSYQANGKPLITNDGVTVARSIEPTDPIERLGAKLIKEVAERTNDNAGDGTSTATILMQSVVHEGMKAIEAGADGILMRRGIEAAATDIAKSVKAESVKADTLDKLTATATISCRNPELGAMVATIVQKAGAEGIITLEDNIDPETVYEQQEGLKLTGGLLHDLFINIRETHQAKLNNVPILVTTQTISIAQEMGKIMDCVISMGYKDAVILANGIEGDALSTSAVNWQKDIVHILPIRVISYGDLGEGMLKDVASITGAAFIDQSSGINFMDITPEHFGIVKSVVVDKHNTIVISDDEKAKEDRIIDLKAALKSEDREYDKENIKERIAKLQSTMFTIKVGGTTETVRNELRTRVEDAVNATRAALAHGVTAGGGSALYRAASNLQLDGMALDDFLIGYRAVIKACTRPILQMADNSGIRLGQHELDSILPTHAVIDFTTGKTVDGFEAGIIDPVKVVLEALANSTSEAALFLTSEGAITDTTNEADTI